MYKSYASYFASYLLENLKNSEGIIRIILFGSVAKEQADKESDIDIFIEINKKNKKIENEINNLLDRFYKSREALLFKAKGIDNKINLIIGKLDEWKDLKKSVESTGILLYGPFEINNKGSKKKSVIYWSKINKNRGAFLNKIYGFRIKDKKYRGLLEEFNGRKLGKSCIMIPVIYRSQIEEMLKKYNVEAKVIDVYSD